MSRHNLTFKSTFNAALHLLEDLRTGAPLPSEARLAAALDASRTTVRAVLSRLEELGLIHWEGRVKTVLRRPEPEDFYSEGATEDPAEQARQRFLEWVMRTDLPPGARFTEAGLARELGLTTAMVRDLLSWCLPLGLMEKKPNKSWVMLGFTQDYATEMCDLRDLIEMAAIRQVAAEPEDAPIWAALADMERRHIALLARDDSAIAGFPELDAAFHRVICAAPRNRFYDDFAARISIIVHYHYQWNKRDEVTRNRAAIREHLQVMQALLRGRKAEAIEAHAAHLATARATLMASVNWS